MTHPSALLSLSALVITFLWVPSPLGQTAAPGRGERGDRERTGSNPSPRLPTRWWKNAEIAKQVGLTRSQSERIDAIFEQFLKPQRERWNVFRPLEKELNDLLGQPHADEKKVIDLVTRLEARRSEMNRNRFIMLFRIQQVLNPSQRAKLKELGWPASTVSAPPHGRRR